jgi:hypothetical protein
MVSEDSQQLFAAESFLLVFRTCRIVTANEAVAQDSPGFPAYSRLRTARSPVRGAAPPACLGASYLRHVCYLCSAS